MVRRTSKLGIIMSLFVLIFTFMPSVANAESPAFKAAKFQVSIQPELDDPRTLVIYQADLYVTGSDTVKKGTQVSFVIPKGAQINMACEINAQGGHDCQPYETKDLGNGNEQLWWKSSKDIAPNQKYPVYLEFYYDNGAKAPNKSFDYKFSPVLDIDALSFAVTTPKAASNVKVEPAPSRTSQDQNGTNYFLDFTNKTPKDNVDVKVSYVKSDNKPTFDKPQVGSQTTSTPQGGGGAGNWWSSPSVWIPASLFVVVLAALLIFALKNPKRPDGKNNSFAPVKTKPVKRSAEPTGRGAGVDKKKLRQMLLDGKISEDTYKSLLSELNEENKG